MVEFKQIELIDSCLYLYLTWGWINMILSIVFLWIVFNNWRDASRAVNPSQYRLRNKYIVSLITAILANLIHALNVVFGVTNAIVPWDYTTLPHTYQQILIFSLVFGGFLFVCMMNVSFLIRVSILYELNKLQSIILHSFTMIFAFIIVIGAVMVSLDGVDLAHFQDKSTGIGIIRPIEQSISVLCKYVILPISLLSFLLLSFIYSYKMKLLKTVSNTKERELIMPIVLKESILVITACSVSIIWSLCVVLIPNDNVLLFCTMAWGLMLICIFLMFDFNHRIYFKVCYYPSVFWLNLCCIHGKNVNDEELLSLQLSDDYNVLKQEFDIDDREIEQLSVQSDL